MNNIFYQFDQLIEHILQGFIIVQRRVAILITRFFVLNFSINTSKLPQKEFLHIFERLSMLLSAGVSLSNAVSILHNQTSNSKQRYYLKNLNDEIIQGRLLSKTLTTETNLPLAFKTLIVLGERTGTLSLQMSIAVTELKRSRQAKQRVRLALLYPFILLVVTLAITLFLLIVIFPKITPIFTTFDSQLPLSTRMLISFSSWLNDNGLFIIGIIIILLCLLFFSAQRSARIREILGIPMLTIPGIKYVVRTWNVIQICRMLSVLLSSGVRSSDAALMVAGHIKNPQYQKAMYAVGEQLVTGRKISSLLMGYPKLFSLDMVGLISVAEQSGSLPKTLDTLATLYEHDLDEYQKMLTTLIEPLLMIVMGLTIGFIAISIITPIYGLTNVLSQ